MKPSIRFLKVGRRAGPDAQADSDPPRPTTARRVEGILVCVQPEVSLVQRRL